MLRLAWDKEAAEELEAFWKQADLATRTEIFTALLRLESELLDEPENVGESRDELRRIHFSYPLAVTFQIYEAEKLVVILHARVYRRKV